MASIVIDPRFRGPDASGNGGYTCGRIAHEYGGIVDVMLRVPPPLDTPLEADPDGHVRFEDTVVALVEPTELDLEPPAPVSFDDAVAAQRPDLGSPFPECFVCGHARGDDGLHIHAGPVPGRDVYAAPWVVAEDAVGPEFVWAVLDCPGAYATGAVGRGWCVLGKLAARIDRVPQAGERCVVVAWNLGSEGRKYFAGTAVFTDAGELLGIGRATWIGPRD